MGRRPQNTEHWSVCDESGLDNSARFTGTGVLRAIDLNCFMAREYQILAELASQLNLESNTWKTKANQLIDIIERDLNEDKGIYCDVDQPESILV